MAIAEAIPLLHKIHTTGYWRVNIRPTVFDAHRIPDLSTCKALIRDCKVSLRGWDFPHISQSMSSNQDWIESEVDSNFHVEYWRFYQSGQFIHHSACWEDYESPEPKILDMLSTLFIMTEVFEFAGRLAEKGVLAPEAHISVILNGMKGRTLDAGDRYLSGPYIANSEKIGFQEEYTQEKLITSRNEVSLKATMFVFERFNWEHPSEQVLREDQRKYLERRF